ncbi:hypothetical protein AAFF_G00348890 [Aldrovandia affinis]|uniref:Uncharacterized protein n=1 Tax=Aldrovandia affinis TaxID=143900 RepID=A0AAD7SJS7_9TELE|nr:hypothetical protein AAFF_G00348890 [Aldrovandia affinis]
MRAHRIYGDKSDNPSDRPRTLIFSLLRYPDRQTVLQAARKFPLIVDGKEISFFTDYSKHTAQSQKNFFQLIKRAYDNGVHAFLLYPDRLKLIHKSKAHLSICSPVVATKFLDLLCLECPSLVTSMDSNN